MCTIDNAGDCCAGADECKGGEQRVFVRQTGNQTLGNSTQRWTTGSNQSNQKTSNHQKNTYFHALFHAVVNAPSEDEQKTNKRHNDTANLPVKPKEQIDRNSAAEKKWDTEDIKNGTLMWDVILGAGSIALIVLLVLLTSAKILYPQGITVSEVNDLTMLFKTIVGAAAPYLLGICLLAASASSLLVSAQMGATLLLAGFGREAKMEDKDVQWLSVIILALGALTAFIFGSSSPTQVLLIANICAVINAPLLAILIIMIVNRKEMGEFKSSKINNILLSLCCAGLLAVTVYNLCKLLHIV